MRISEIDFGKISHIEVVSEIKNEKFQFQKKEVECKIQKSGNYFELIVLEKRITVKGKYPHHQKALDDIKRTNIPRLFWIVNYSDSSCSIQIHEFTGKNSLGEEKLEIGLNEKIFEEIEKRLRQKEKEKAIDWLKGELLLRYDDPNIEKVRFFISSTPDDTSKESQAFRIHGKNISVDIKLDKEKSAYFVKRIVNSKNKNNQSASIQIVEAIIEFKDETVLGKLKDSVKQDLVAITSEKDSYIRLWEEYNLLEEKMILDKAREIGYVQYSSVSFEDDTYKFILNENAEKWIGRIEEEIKQIGAMTLEAGEDIPDYLKAGSKIVELDKIKEFKKSKQFIGTLEKVGIQKKEIILVDEDEEKERKPSKTGYIYLSFTGDMVRLERRKTAIDTIRSGNAPISYISLFLEEKGVIPKTEIRKLEPMTANVHEVFKGNANSFQKQAIGIALNTPDIALIQGPPGTGKTKVISALCHRIIEEAKKNNEPIQKMILITAFQHDAVTNAAERTEVFGLPTVKVGKKKKEEEFFSPALKQWIKDKQENIRSQLSQLDEPSVSLELKKVRDVYISYTQSPQVTKERILQMFNEIKEIVKHSLSGKTIDLLNEQIKKIKQPIISIEEDTIELALRSVRSLRTEQITYSDDGQISVGKVIKRLENLSILEKEELTFLNGLSKKSDPSIEEFAKLKELKGFLIDRLNAKGEPKKVEEFSNEEITSLFISIINELDQKRNTSKDSIIFPLNDFLNELENNPIQIKDSISYYTSVLASTVQKSDDIKIYIPGSNQEQVVGDFDTVIIDEAARANPLDLMIPFTKASKRIILVGDHRQLPHMLEDKVESEIEAFYMQEENITIKDQLNKSLFERLFKRLRELEKADGIPRTITLNEQYRMHPVIGDFISKVFYERNGETQIGAGRKAEDLAHNFSRFKFKPLVWFDLPFVRGREEYGNSGSKLRKNEAVETAKLLKELIEKEPTYTFGVISFYRSQVETIWSECRKLGIAKLVDNNYVIEESLRETESNEERLRIGTVDSFQGKEFDVVILSMTRSNSYTLDEEKPETFKKKYGFLLLENRLNVAMSRAKRLLIVAGDSDMIKAPFAEKGIYGLTEFYKLTGGEDGIRI